MTITTLITSSLRKIGVVASGEVPDVNELYDTLAALQSMLRSWSAAKINVFATAEDTLTLVVGTGSYTWGTGGNINSARPHSVTYAYILDSAGTSHPVSVKTEAWYKALAVKTTSARPYGLFLHPLFPLAYLYLYPVPDAAETLYLGSLKPFTETSSFDALESTLAMPVEYEEAIIYNLAVRMAPEFGKTIPAEVAVIAKSSYDRLITLNAANQVEPALIILPAGRAGAGYNINSDSYR